MNGAMKFSDAALILTLASFIGLVGPAHAAQVGPAAARWMIAQAMVPPTGMDDAQHPMPMNKRMLMRFPQPVRVGDLIGLPVLGQDASTLGYVRQVVRTSAGNIVLVVSYSRFWGWFGRPVAVPIELVGIEGRQLVSLDMPPSQYAAAPRWRRSEGTMLPAEATVSVALARN
jgi:hypothetical protein